MADRTKRCNACEEVKLVSDFYANKCASDGLSTQCRGCVKARVKLWKAENADRVRASELKNRERRNARQMERYRATHPNWKPEKGPRPREALPEKACTNCGIVKPLAEFNNAKDSYDGKTPACSECHRKYARQRYQANPEQALAYLKQWRKRNPDAIRRMRRRWDARNPDKKAMQDKRRYARKRGALVGAFSREKLEQRLAMFSGCWMCGGPADTIDHVKPLAAGGPHLLANIRPACRSCNCSKRHTWPYEVANG